MKKGQFINIAVLLLLGGSVCSTAYGQKKPRIIKEKSAPVANATSAASVEPDKVLYNKALDFMKHGRYTEARLNFQTLINTYPDSEFLAKAKLGSADSFYKEGGTSSMIQAIAEYKEFIVFFPMLDEAAYAQMQVAMGHYRMMEKSDRDSSQAAAAEQEFQTFLLKYPESPLRQKAEQYLRDVQEVLADGEFKIGSFYYLRARQYPQDLPAATARLMEVTERYPLYSKTDQALWMMGDVYMRAKQLSKNEDQKNHWADLAGQCYEQIVKNYPLSGLAPDAKSHLTAMGMAVPPANPEAVERMKQEQLYVKQHHSSRPALINLPLGIIKSSPDVSMAAHIGMPNLSAPDNVVSATDVLRPGAAGPSFTVTASLPADPDSNESTTPVEAVPASSTPGAGSTGIGVEIIAAPSSEAAAASPATAPEGSSNGSGGAPSATPTPSAVAPDSTNTVSGSAASQSSVENTQPAVTQQAAPKNDSSTESTSKKKKGLKKIIPF